MSAVRGILLIALALMSLSLPCLAGVVEDAEETLQTVPTDNPAPRSLDGSNGGSSPDYGSTSSTSASTSSASDESGRPANSTRGTRAPGGGSGGASAGSRYPEASQTPVTAQQEAALRRQARNSADTKLSLLGVLVLLALVAAAGIFSKRVRRDD